MQDADEGLSGSEAAVTSAPSAFCLDALDEGLDDRQRDVGFQQRHAHFAQRFADVFFGDAAAAAQGVDGARQPRGEVFEKGHGTRIILCLLCENAPSPILGIALVVLLLLIAFSSGTEVAMLSANRYKIRAAAKAGKRTARVLDALLSKPDSWLGANLVVLALASVAASSIATLLAQRTGYEHAIPVTMAVLSVVMIVFCELAPKIYAALETRTRGAVAPRTSTRCWCSSRRPSPGSRTRWRTDSCGCSASKPARGDGATMSAEELRSVVAEAGPMIPTRHRQMLLSILDLEHITVNDIMIPRQEIASINVEDNWEDILDQLRQTPHTRLPLHDGELDNLIGIIHMKRVAQELARDTLTRERLIELARAREPYFVPEGTPLNVQLNAFQRNRRRLAFVVDEYGDIQGFVTLEDILEEIVGEFTTDPATVTHKHVHREAAGVFIINASATIRALNRSLGWQLPTDGPKTLNGLLVEKLETLPESRRHGRDRRIPVRSPADRREHHPHRARAARDAPIAMRAETGLIQRRAQRLVESLDRPHAQALRWVSAARCPSAPARS